jgi:hypothetical protein
MQMDSDTESDENTATPRPHKHVNAHVTQIDEEPFRTPLVLARKNLKYPAVKTEDTEEHGPDHSDSENSGDVHERQRVRLTCLLLRGADNRLNINLQVPF